MTPKVGAGQPPTASAGRSPEDKRIRSLSFARVIETVLSSSVSGPARPSGRIPGDVEQLTGRGDRHFARNGTAFAAEPDTASKVVDPLELSLAQPCAWTPRDAPRLQPVAVDTIALAALERVVERLSFGGDRRS